MSAPELRFASMHPALHDASVMHGFDRDEFFRRVAEVYPPLSKAQEDQLYQIVQKFALLAAQYHLAVKRSELQKFTAGIGLQIDGLLNDMAAPMLGFEYENIGDYAGDIPARFLSRRKKLLDRANFERDRDPTSRYNQSRPLLADLEFLSRCIHEGEKPFADIEWLEELQMSPDNLLGELAKLRNYVVVLTEMYCAQTSPTEPRAIESQRTALHHLIEQTHEWAGGHGLPRAARGARKAPTAFTTLIDLIVLGVDRWLVRFSTPEDCTSDDEKSVRKRVRGQLIDMPNNLDALAKVIEKCITAANKRKRLAQQHAPLP